MNGGLGLAGVLLVVFIVLKLSHVIAWSWLWVLAPLWVPFALLGVFAIALFIWVSLQWAAGKNPFN